MPTANREGRLRAVCELMMASAREDAGIHDFDGEIQDLSPSGVDAALARLGGPAEEDPADEAHLAAFEAALRVRFGEIEEHRRNPLTHLSNLDLACYDRQYTSAPDRAEARRRPSLGVARRHRHRDHRPYRVPAPVARALLPAVRGLADSLDGTDSLGRAALAAHRRFVVHVEKAAEVGEPDAALGGQVLARLLSASEATAVDLGRLAERADGELRRLQALLAETCERRPGVPPDEVVRELLRDHPDAEGVLAEARAQST